DELRDLGELLHERREPGGLEGADAAAIARQCAGPALGLVQQGLDPRRSPAVHEGLEVPRDVRGFQVARDDRHAGTLRGATSSGSGRRSAWTTASWRVARVSTT